jgi:acetyl esterase/lipase
MRAYLKSISPITHADRIVQPLFIAQGANDPRVPQSEADQMVATIRSHGGEVWYFLARDEGHGFRKKNNRDHYNNAVALFLRTHLLNAVPDLEELLPPEQLPEGAVESAAPVEVPEDDHAEESDDAMHAPLEPPSEDGPEEPLDPVPEPSNGQSTLAQVQQFR